MLPPDAYDVARQTLAVLLPEILILLAAIVMMTSGAFVRLPRRVWSGSSALVLLAALLALLAVRHESIDLYSGVALNDAFSFDSRLVLLFTGFILLALAHDQVDDARAPEFFGALLMIDAGAMLVAASNELVFLFVGLELVSIPTYLLLYLPKRSTTTQEAATKYFFLSIFSSGLLLYGLAFLYGLTGVSNLKALAFLAQHVPTGLQPELALIAVVFVMAGLGFKVAAVPFHFYAPDVYQGSPAVIAAMLSWIPKAIGFLALARTLSPIIAAGQSGAVLSVTHSGNELVNQAVIIGWIVAAISMTLGNTVALVQNDLKRLLAYSSIAHAGFLMMGVTASFYSATASDAPGGGSSFVGTQGVLIYLVAYALMTLGAFGVIIALSTPKRTIETVDDLAGLGQSHPALALALALCLFSLAGIPPLAGFYGKFAIFASAFSVGASSGSSLFWWLGVVGVLNAAVGAYYYLRIVVLMYLRPAPATPILARVPWPTALAVGTCAVLSLLLGLFPAPIFTAAKSAAESAVALPDPSTATMAVNAPR